MIKDILKLVIGLWIAKHFVLDNDLISGLTDKIKSMLKDFLK